MSCYLSIVVSASNADYGGDFLSRLQKFVDDKAAAIGTNKIDAELIVVEWNPPQDRQPLSTAINWRSAVPTKVVIVSKELHDRYFNPGGFSFLEYMAKNVGIRRAKGDFILATNVDVILSMQMDGRLASHSFSGDEFYRANRHDWDRNGQVFQINYANGTFPPWENIEGKSKTGVPYRVNMPHFNASGDFMLMSKKNWMDLRGYPENTGYLITLDGEMVHIALTAGLKQVVLPEPIYHQFHEHSPVKPWYTNPLGWEDSTPRGTKNEKQDWGLGNVDLPTQKVS